MISNILKHILKQQLLN